MRILPVFATLLWFIGAGTVTATVLRGQDDARFQSALALWLADAEETALPELAALAAEGNRAAQLLLAQIDVTPSFHGPWLSGLPRAERSALLRAPGGLSGRSWMQAAAEDTPLARLLLVQNTPAVTAETALALAEMGEFRAARKALSTLAAGEYRGFAAIADDPNYPPDMRFLIWREWSDDPATRDRAEAEIAALHPGDPQRAHFDSRTVDPAAFDDWLASASLAAPLREPCQAACPDAVRSCTRAGFALLSSSTTDVAVFDSGHGDLLALGPPSETIVPFGTWIASPRGRAAVLRQSEVRTRYAEAIFARVALVDACFAAMLVDESGRFPK